MIKEVSAATPDGKDLAERSLSAERCEIYWEAANKQTHRNVGLLRGPGYQPLTRVLAKKKKR